MRIAHISDLHIRNFKYRDEYKRAFDNLYLQLDGLRPDLVINTGDTVHSKLAVSPELFDDVATHCIEVCKIAPYWVILGNHDLNLKNKSRTDAISPIVRALQGRTEYELRMPEEAQDVPERMARGKFEKHAFWHYDIRNKDHTFSLDPSDVNIGLYHGSIAGCVTDMGFVMEDAEAQISQFDQMDYVLMGDIHKRQSFRGGRMQYPGSLIQQNYGEELEKGFLVWEIGGKDDFEVNFHPVSTKGRFFTIQVPQNFDLTDITVPPGSRIRAKLEGELSPSRRLQLEKLLTERFQPLEVITPDSSGERLEELDLERLVPDRSKMMDDHLEEKGISEDQKLQVRRLWREFEAQVEDVGLGRGTTWSLKNLNWDNMMNYGEANSIDFTKLNGLVGIFAPNASGKSTIFDVMTEALFDKVAKEVPRNIDLINDNKDVGLMNVEFETNGQSFFIERSIERITYGQRKLTETKQWGKTSLDFASGGEPLNGTSRPETEKHIRSIIGSFDDFVLSTMLTQNPIFGLPGGGDIINCKETDRRKILFRFLDLDIYERIHQMCKEELKSMLSTIKGQSEESFKEQLEQVNDTILGANADIKSGRADVVDIEDKIQAKTQLLAQLQADDAVNLTSLDDRVTMLHKAVRKGEAALTVANNGLLECDEKLKELNAIPLKRPEIELTALTEQMEAVRASREDLKLHLSKQRDALTRGKKALVTLDGVPCEGKFPSCKFIAEASEFLTQREIVETSISMGESAVQGANTQFSTLEQYSVMHKDALRWERAIAEETLRRERCLANVQTATLQVQQARAALVGPEKELQEAYGKIRPDIHSEIADLKLQLEKDRVLLRDEQNYVENLLRTVGALEAKRATIEVDFKKFLRSKQTITTYELLCDMSGKTGLPYRILTRVLPVINHEIANILTGVAKFSVFFEDDPDTQSVGLYIRYGDYKSRPLGLGSGAEKFIASVAIRCALLSVSSLPKTDILIIDEGFGKLDPENLEALQRMFEYLKESFGTVFIVSHVDFMRDIVDHSIEITSRDGYAHVTVG